MMADPKHLYREIVDLERQLRELLRSNPLNAQDANVLRSRLIERAKALASASPAFAASKEIEQVLWKPCFYKRIEDFRLRIRKYASAAAAAPSASDRSVRDHFARVSSEFQAFLRDAAAFYDHVRGCYSAWLATHHERSANLQAVVVTTPDPAIVLSASKCRQSLHRCYIFLGDLARYRELHSQKAKKNFAAAESFYHKALALVPENGNPHNQLAVLATYVEAETVAVYRYCRSLLIAQPFSTAEENLALLFERARQRPLAGPSVLVLTAASSAKDKSAYLKSFLHRLTRMHGILFSLATAATASAGNTGNAASAAATSPPAYPREMEAVLVKDLHALLRAGAIGDALLLKIVVINVFCIVRALRSSSASVQAHAVQLAAHTLTDVIEYVHDELTKTGSGSGSDHPNSARLLGPVSVFCDFLRLCPKALDVLDTAPSGTHSEVTTVAAHVRPSAFLEAFAALVNHAKVRALYTPLVTLRNDLQEPLRVQQLLLKENVELRGFAPFAALLESPIAARAWPDASSSNGITSIPEADALRIRAWNLYGFGKYLCDEYDGNPLLYLYQGVFSTTPVVGTNSTNTTTTPSFLHAVAGTMTTTLGASSSSTGTAVAPPPLRATATTPMPAFNLFGTRASPHVVEQQRGSSYVTTPPKHVRAVASMRDDDDDEFDDEVIVFQPSPALSPLPSAVSAVSGVRPGTSGNATATANAPWLTGMTTSSPFADLSAFSLGAPNSQSTPEPKRHSFSDAFSSSSSSGFGASINSNSVTGGAGGTSGIGATLGYPNFHSFGGDFGGFSGRGLAAGWGNSDAALPAPTGNGLGRPPSVPKPSTAFSLSGGGGATSNTSSSASSGTPFAPMMDLAAVERESALYQQEASSLSAFFSAAPRTSSTSNLSNSASVRTSPRPPPGFSGAAASGSSATPSAPSPQFYTRNPFINP